MQRKIQKEEEIQQQLIGEKTEIIFRSQEKGKEVESSGVQLFFFNPSGMTVTMRQENNKTEEGPSAQGGNVHARHSSHALDVFQCLYIFLQWYFKFKQKNLYLLLGDIENINGLIVYDWINYLLS